MLKRFVTISVHAGVSTAAGYLSEVFLQDLKNKSPNAKQNLNWAARAGPFPQDFARNNTARKATRRESVCRPTRQPLRYHFSPRTPQLTPQANPAPNSTGTAPSLHALAAAFAFQGRFDDGPKASARGKTQRFRLAVQRRPQQPCGFLLSPFAIFAERTATRMPRTLPSSSSKKRSKKLAGRLDLTPRCSLDNRGGPVVRHVNSICRTTDQSVESTEQLAKELFFR